MKEIYEKFMERYKAERNPARNTALLIQNVIPKFLSFCQKRGREDINQITREDIIEYLNSLNGIRTSTKKTHKAIITLFMNSCLSYGYRREPVGMVSFKGPSDAPRAPLKGFTAEEMALMKRNLGRLGLRDRIIFNLISNRPLRISELVDLSVGNVNLNAKTFTIFRSKNTKTRVLSLPSETWDDLKEYIKEEWPKENSLFDLSIRYMEFRVGEIIRILRVNPNGRNSHAFRHTAIMSMLRDAKIDPAVVAAIAGNTPRTIYTNYSSQVSIDEQRRAEKAFDQVQRKNNHLKTEFRM
jgi:site-specific recombinase XerD